MLVLFTAALTLIAVLTPVAGAITHECSYVNGKIQLSYHIATWEACEATHCLETNL